VAQLSWAWIDRKICWPRRKSRRPPSANASSGATMPPEATARARSAVAIAAPGTATSRQSRGSPASSGASSVNPVGCAAKPSPARANASHATASRSRREATSTAYIDAAAHTQTTPSGRTPMSCGSHHARNTAASITWQAERTRGRSGAASAMASAANRRSSAQVISPNATASSRCNTGALPTTPCHQPRT
jgi:hypothetical protein